MSETITKEEYENALIKNKELRDKLFQMRLSLEVNKTNEELTKKLKRELKILKHEMAKIIFIIKSYENKIEERGKNL